jgi:hypothetical protein
MELRRTIANYMAAGNRWFAPFYTGLLAELDAGGPNPNDALTQIDAAISARARNRGTLERLDAFEPMPGQMIEDVCRAEALFVEEVTRRHPKAEGKPIVIANCQAGWQTMMTAAIRPDLMGPILHAGNDTMGHVRDRRRPTGTHHKPISNVPTELGYQAMGIPFGSMTTAEISDAIPPAYAKFIAEAWLRSLADGLQTGQGSPRTAVSTLG